jgi:putative membrane protein
VVAGIVLLIWWVVRQSASGRHDVPSHGAPQPPSKALDMLNERYAKGEIDKDEYEERKQALSKQ